MATGPLPTGTLTLLFSDIEGSTDLLHRLGNRWGDALSAQRSILRSVFAAHDGIEMGTEGDSFFVVFSTAHQAVAAAISGQRDLQGNSWPDDVELRVRMGIHTGEPQRHEDGYVGEDVHRAARIGSIANGAQIVLSAATQRLVPHLPMAATLRDLGHHRLKDMPGGEQLFDVVVPGLITEFPPLRSLGRVAALPSWTTPLVGRDGDIKTIVGLVAEPTARLVTLTGPGGSGKTRLAAAAAASLDPMYSDGVYFVGLSAATDAASMWQVIAQSLGVDQADRDAAAETVRVLRDRRVLLVLDNVEQIAEAYAVVGRLLAEAAGVDVLATSRRPLQLIAEQAYPLAPLALPQTSDLEAVAGSAAVAMFVLHARLVQPTFQVTRDNSSALAELCHRLDGLPLALELAAAQSRLFNPAALLARIDGTLGAAFAAHDRPARQRTLDDVVSWSYDLLPESAQALFRQLSVFERSADLEAITSVAMLDGSLVLDAIANLVDANVVRVDDGLDDEPRISMLQTIRSFARHRLEETGQSTEIQMRHLGWCAGVVERTVPMLGTNLHTVALDRLNVIDHDIRAALTFTLDPSLPADPERLAAGHGLLITVTTKYWYRFGNMADARRWQEQALATGDGRDSEVHIGLLFGLGVSILLQGEVTRSVELLTQSLEMSRRLDQQRWQARILNALAVARRQAGDFSASMELLQASLAIAGPAGLEDVEAKALGNLAVLYYDVGDFESAARAAERSLQINTAREDGWAVAIDEINYTAAILRTEGAQAAAARITKWMPNITLYEQPELMIDAIELAGAIASDMHSPTIAAQLLGAADSRRASAATPRTAAEAGRVDAWVDAARRELSAEDWRAAYDAGSTTASDRLTETICSMTGHRH